MHGLFTADQLANRCAAHPYGLRVSRPTVYRTLKQLVECGLVRNVAVDFDGHGIMEFVEGRM